MITPLQHFYIDHIEAVAALAIAFYLAIAIFDLAGAIRYSADKTSADKISAEPFDDTPEHLKGENMWPE